MNRGSYCLKTLLSCLVMLPMATSAMQVERDQEGYRVHDEHGSHTVKNYDVDALLRKLGRQQLKQFLAQGGRIRAKRLDNGDYVLRAYVPGPGGGPIGATVGFFLGKGAVEVVGHGGIWLVSFVAGPAQPALHIALEATLGPVIEGTSNVVGLGCGIAGGVATGPV